MAKKNRYQRWADDIRISAIQWVPDEEQEDPHNPKGRFFVHRTRRARRAQARLDGLKWRDLSLEERFMQ